MKFILLFTNTKDLKRMTMNLYEKDFEQWLSTQTVALKNRNWDAIDVEHLIENLEMGDPKNTLESDLLILIAHLLKLYVQSDAPDWMNKSWYDSIDEHRLRIQSALEKSGSLRRYLPDAVERVYPKARKLAIKEGKRADGRKVIKRKESDYPTQLPNGWFDYLLDEDWYPLNLTGRLGDTGDGGAEGAEGAEGAGGD